MSHTKGPWKIQETSKDHTYGIGNNEGYIIALGVGGLDKHTTDANAALISAAPELLEATKAVITMLKNLGLNYLPLEVAVAKAEGQGPQELSKELEMFL